MIRSRRSLSVLLALGVVNPSLAQEFATTKPDTITINCPDQVDLAVMADYVGQTLGIRFVYGEELKGQKVDLRPSPIEVPKDMLLQLLVTLLRVKDLILVEDSPRFYRVVRSEQMTRSSATILPAGTPASAGSLRLATLVLRPPTGIVEGLADKLSKFLSSPKSEVVAFPERGLLIVTDYESRLAVLQELLSVLDVGGWNIEVQTIPVEAGDAAALAAQVTSILAETHRLRKQTTLPPSVRADLAPENLVVVGTIQQIAEAQGLIERFLPKDRLLVTKPYSPRYLSVDRVKSLLDNVVLAPGCKLAPPARFFRDDASGRIFITAESETHAAISRMLQTDDVPLADLQRPLRIHRLKNRKASELIGVLSQLLGEGAVLTTISGSEASAITPRPIHPPGPNRSPAPAAPIQVPPKPPVAEPHLDPPSATRSLARVQGPDYVLTEDAHTNAILAVGSREFHTQMEALIGDLDRRRPQVLIEMTLVAITFNDSLDLGVELEHLDLGDAWDHLIFSNFGLSTISPTTGARTLVPGVGANGVLLSPEETPLIIRALSVRGNARVISTPKLLVSDNTRGTLRSVDEAPFTSVNASDTVATTSFAGFESAGTTLSVTPHISEGDHLNLEYELSFSNFTGSSSGTTVPPPRTTNSFTSTVDVPDGYTVVTGGLVIDNRSESISEVPLLGRIPAVGKLFQNSTRRNTKTKVFAFIRPLIVREDEFEELKFVTLQETQKAELVSEHRPPAEPLWMK